MRKAPYLFQNCCNATKARIGFEVPKSGPSQFTDLSRDITPAPRMNVAAAEAISHKNLQMQSRIMNLNC
jgi:hypothetical protein